MRKAYIIKYYWYEFWIECVFTHLPGPMWPWLVGKQEEYQRWERFCGRPWKVH